MVIKGSDRSDDIKTRERKPMEIRTAPRAAAQKAMRDKLEKQARDISIANNYVNQNPEYSDQSAQENYGTDQVEQLSKKT